MCAACFVWRNSDTSLNASELTVLPDSLAAVITSGFSRVDIRYQAPYPEHDKLQRVTSPALGDAAGTLNANVDKLNSLLFTYLDYAAIARRT